MGRYDIVHTYTVTTNGDESFDGGDFASETADGGGLSLREAIGLSNAIAGPDTILFAAGIGGLFRLTAGEIVISDELTIDGGGLITITGDANDDDITTAGDITDVAASLEGEDRLDDNSRIFRFCLNLCGATILRLEKSGGEVVISKKRWSPAKDVSVQNVERLGAGEWLVSGTLAPRGICPDCGLRSRRRHGWRHRRLQDFPAHGDGVTLALRVCRWRCSASACPRRTFSDHVPSIALPFARRTSRVGEIVSHLGHATGGRPAERLLHRLGVAVSDDTVLRHLKRRAETISQPPKVVGIDDWSWRKSQTYGTIIVDLERRTVIDVLEDRTVEKCTSWLCRHPEIEVVSRDRCGLYAKAARQGAPQALQVADRFHLVQNLRQAVEEEMNMHGRATGRALLSDADNISTDLHLQRSRLVHRQSREEIFTKIHALREQGLCYSEIERRTGFKRRSVAKWLKSEAPPDRRRATLNNYRLMPVGSRTWFSRYCRTTSWLMTPLVVEKYPLPQKRRPQ